MVTGKVCIIKERQLGIIVVTLFVLCLLAGLCPRGAVLAGELGKPEIRLPEGYPPGFNGWGRIDRLGTKDLVIDERLHLLSPFISYNTPQAKNTTTEAFKPGKLVGYLLDEEGKTILSLWLLD